MESDTEPIQDQTERMSAEAADAAFNETVWSYRGYKLRASEFTTSMVHLFRAEIQRANAWRLRLDTTTNWAVVSTGAAVSVAFSQQGHHIVMLMNVILVTMFLVIEARRYRYYELWSFRVRLMETDFFAAMLVPPFHPSADWAEGLAESLLHPDFPISNLEAVGRRLRRNYMSIYFIIGIGWLAKLWLVPDPAIAWSDLPQRAAIGPINGTVVLTIVALFYLSLLVISVATIGLQQAPGEVLPRYGAMADNFMGNAGAQNEHTTTTGAWYRPSRRRKQLLTLIITDKEQQVSQKIIQEMKRGVTALSGTGMFTGRSHGVLLCALTVSEVPHLKELVKSADPNSFIIVSPAQEIFGKGFTALQDEGRKKETP